VAGSFRIAEGYVEVTADESGYDRAIDRLKAKKTSVKIGVDLDDKDALAKLERLTRDRLTTVKLKVDETALSRLRLNDIEVTVSPKMSDAAYNRVKAQLDRLTERTRRSTSGPTVDTRVAAERNPQPDSTPHRPYRPRRRHPRRRRQPRQPHPPPADDDSGEGRHYGANPRPGHAHAGPRVTHRRDDHPWPRPERQRAAAASAASSPAFQPHIAARSARCPRWLRSPSHHRGDGPGRGARRPGDPVAGRRVRRHQGRHLRYRGRLQGRVRPGHEVRGRRDEIDATHQVESRSAPSPRPSRR
jgi:hypothetical protein